MAKEQVALLLAQIVEGCLDIMNLNKHDPSFHCFYDSRYQKWTFRVMWTKESTKMRLDYSYTAWELEHIVPNPKFLADDFVSILKTNYFPDNEEELN